MNPKAVEEDIQKQYECIDRLGSGAFGHLILVRSKMNEQQYACKIEKNHGKKVVLVEKQFKILADLMDTKQFPEVYSFKILEKHSYMIMEKLNETLDHQFKIKNRKFSLKTIALIINQLLEALRSLHSHGIVHRDIKPENIMTTCNSHQIKLIDFGLADTLFAKQSMALIGNVRFCSRKAHFGYSGKKEDLESLLYVIYYFILHELPWQPASEDDIRYQIQRDVTEESEKKTFILLKKQQFLDSINYEKTSNEVVLAFYCELHELASIIHHLKDDNEIDYNELIHRSERLMCIIGVEQGDCFDWCGKHCPFKKSPLDYWKVFE